MKAEFAARQGFHRQRVVIELAVGEFGDGQNLLTVFAAHRRALVEGIVLVHEKGVKELLVPAGAVNLVERQVLVLERVVVGVLQLVEQVDGGGGRGDVRAHRHRVDQQADHRLRVGHFQLAQPGSRRAEHDVVLAGQRGQQQRPGALQHGADGGVARAGQLAERRVVCSRNAETTRSLARRAPADPAADLVGRPAWARRSRPSASRHAARAASRSRSASQVMNFRYDAAGGSRCP